MNGRTAMTRRALIDYCLTMPQAYEDYPFRDLSAGDSVWTVMRHGANRKAFAFIFERNGRLCVNLKCDPAEAILLRQAFEGVTPAFHMNKEHWNTVTLGADVPVAEVHRQIEQSYDLIKPRRKAKSRS